MRRPNVRTSSAEYQPDLLVAPEEVTRNEAEAQHFALCYPRADNTRSAMTYMSTRPSSLVVEVKRRKPLPVRPLKPVIRGDA